MHWPSYFAPLIAFGGRFDVTGLIPADQYHRRVGHGFRFLLPPFLYYPPPLFSKFSYKSFLFQNLKKKRMIMKILKKE
jgi:hypothetical protein